MAGRGAKNAVKRKSSAGYEMPPPIPRGEIMTDSMKKRWFIGESIGVGGFGEIYSAALYDGKKPKDYPMVVKIEPHGNGPLFVEMHFYMRNAKPYDIQAWMKKRRISHLGMPRFFGSGSHEYRNTKYRFLVMERFGTDLWKLFLENGRRFPEPTVYRIALQIIDVLEYIHDRTYVHGDIKGTNLLLSLESPNSVYLVDFGLASHYTTEIKYKRDPKKAHNGSIEYTSGDAHMGVPTMRGDFEILGYNMIQWLCGSLPWEKNLKDSSAVQEQKEKAFEDIPKFLKFCFSSNVPMPIFEYMRLLGNMEFDDEPNYARFRKILLVGLGALRSRLDGDLKFSGSGRSVGRPVKTPSPDKFKPKYTSTPILKNKNAGTTQKKNEREITTPVRKTGAIRKSPRSGPNRKIVDWSDSSDSEFAPTSTRSPPKRSTKNKKVHFARRESEVKFMSSDSESEEIQPKRRPKRATRRQSTSSDSESDHRRPRRSSRKTTPARDFEYMTSESESDSARSKRSFPRRNRNRSRKATKLSYMTEDSDSDQDMFQD